MLGSRVSRFPLLRSCLRTKNTVTATRTINPTTTPTPAPIPIVFVLSALSGCPVGALVNTLSEVMEAVAVGPSVDVALDVDSSVFVVLAPFTAPCNVKTTLFFS